MATLDAVFARQRVTFAAEAAEGEEAAPNLQGIIKIKLSQTAPDGPPPATLTGPQPQPVLTIIRMADLRTIVPIPSAVDGRTSHPTLVKSLSTINDF